MSGPLLLRRRGLLGADDWKADYVRDGLLMWLDGEHNGPGGVHNDPLVTWYDQSGNGYDWSNHGAEVKAQCVSFPYGATQYLDRETLPVGVAYMELAVLFKRLPTYSAILTGFGEGSQVNGNMTALNARLTMRIDGRNRAMPIQTNVVYSATSTGYLNGVLQEEDSGTGGWTAKVPKIGAYNTGNSSAFSGQLYAIRLYDRVLTDAERQKNLAADARRFGIEVAT